MGTNRLEAFFDGVVAIIITIMVLEMKVPHGESIEAVLPLIPVLLSYVLSFVYLGIYWNNHHHMLHACHRATGSILQQRIIASQGEGSVLRRAVGNDWKGRLSPALYVVAILVAFLSPWVSVAIYVFAALMWVVPDRRIERVLTGHGT
jgi:uncharacterized membrane protein